MKGKDVGTRRAVAFLQSLLEEEEEEEEVKEVRR